MWPVSVLFLLVTLTADPPRAPEIRFIGNAAFELTDGQSTVLLDFPYVSGAFGYMTYPGSEIHARESTLCLFTHEHADHFDATTLDAVGCSVAGPAAVRTLVGERAVRGEAGGWSHGVARIECIPSDHGGIDHCSYRIDWGDTTILVSGDVEALGPLLDGFEDLDVALVSTWLAPQVEHLRERFPGVKIVLSHATSGEGVPRCEGCRLPSQGQRVTF